MVTPNLKPHWSADADNNSFGAQSDKKNYQDVAVVDPQTDVSAEQWVTLADRVKTSANTASFAKVRYSQDDTGGNDPTVLMYKGQHAIGPSFAPTLTREGDGYVSAVWDSSYTDFYSQSGAIKISGAVAHVQGSSFGVANCEIINSTTVLVRCFDETGSALTDVDVQLEVDCRGE